jgi:hypothetical protein
LSRRPIRQSRHIVNGPNVRHTTLMAVSTAISGVMSAYLPCSRRTGLPRCPYGARRCPRRRGTRTFARNKLRIAKIVNYLRSIQVQ